MINDDFLVQVTVIFWTDHLKAINSSTFYSVRVHVAHCYSLEQNLTVIVELHDSRFRVLGNSCMDIACTCTQQ